MKILFLNTSFPPMARSAANLYYELSLYFISRGHEVEVVTEYPWRRLAEKSIKSFKLPKNEIINNIKIYRIKSLKFKENKLLVRGITELILPITFFWRSVRLEKKDISLVYSPPLTLGLTAYFLKLIRKIPFVLNVQDIYPQTPIDLGYLKNKFLIRFLELMESFIYRKADYIVVHSEGNRQYLIKNKKIPPKKIVTIPNWVDLKFIQPSVRMNNFRRSNNLGNKFILCYAGTMGYAQDLKPFIEAARELRQYRDILFLFIGDGVRFNEWCNKIEKQKLENVKIMPLQPREMYPLVVSASDIGLIPLIKNLTTPVVPGKLLDFMAGSRPVIATVKNNGDAAKIIKKANCGFVISSGKGKEVANIVLKIYQNPSLREKLGKNGRIYAEKYFSLNSCGERFEELFSKIIE